MRVGEERTASISDEDYLAALLGLEEDAVPPIQARLADRLGISAAAVSEAVPRLVYRGFLEPGERSLRLAPAGRSIADTVVRRHRLAECLLVDVLGLAWEKVHLEAALWEHVITDDVEDRLVVLLGDPATCPHGNRIPGSRKAVHRMPEVRLAAAPPGHVTVARISEQLQVDGEALGVLSRSRLTPGCSARIVTVSAEWIALETPSGDVTIPSPIAEHVWVCLASG